MNLPSWVSKVQAAWIALGTFLTILSLQSGLQIPSFLAGLFSQETFDAIITTVTAVFTFYQYMKGIFIANAPSSTDVGVSSLSVEKVRNFAFNPFKLRVK